MERTFEGRLFDLYPLGDRMVLWITTLGGERIRLEDPWPYPIYARGEEETLDRFLREGRRGGALGDVRLVERTEFWTGEALPVRRIEVLRYDLLPRLRRRLFALEAPGRGEGVRFWNVDLDPARYWLTAHRLFPLARLRVVEQAGRLLEAQALDGRDDVDWRIPPLAAAALTLERDAAFPLGRGNRLLWTSDGTTRVLDGDGWPEVLQALCALLLRDDPDVLVTDRGDTKILPSLVEAARRHRVPLPLDREPHPPPRGMRSEGTTFFQYGKVLYKEPPFPLYGRWHLDRSTSFFHGEAGLEGLLEAARLAQVPVQQMARTSPGTGVSAMEVSLAVSQGILVPWHKARGEDWKTADTLLTADKGGLVYTPIAGLHGDVVEVDFASMYPALMVAHNLSPETVLCRCCAGDPEAPRVPESGYWICRRREGLVRETLRPFIEKRARYKALLKEARDPAGYRRLAPAALERLEARARELARGRVPLEDLAVTTTLSRDPAGYRVENRSALAAREMARGGVDLHAGESVRYLLLRHDAPLKDERVRAVAFLRPEDTPDVGAYLALLADAAWELLACAGYARAALRARLISAAERGR